VVTVSVSAVLVVTNMARECLILAVVYLGHGAHYIPLGGI
jgi:hypothetical protein